MAQDFHLLALNPGSTTTKIAVFAGDKVRLEEKLEHAAEDLQGFARATDQDEYRLKMILDILAAAKVDLNSLNAVVGRGGLLRPLPGGTFRVNKQMVDDLLHRPAVDHASNLGAVLAYQLGQKLAIPAFIVDPVVVDEYEDVARFSGYPGLERQSRSHALNMKAVARRVARDLGRAYRDVRLVVAHLGSGFSISVHVGGRMVDSTNPNDEGPFSIERGGDLPVTLLLPFLYEKFRAGWSLERLEALFIKEAGLYAYTGTKDLRLVEERAAAGDQDAALILKAMSYQVAKAIGAMATVAEGRVDRIILTGGVAHSRRITEDISRRVKFIAPVLVIPGEEELLSLAQGALRVLRGEEEAQDY
ncbi:MAG: butyrate kinase [Firmicutes bacterium]|nr:butyrate kinase [Bacillota bacterium]